MEADEKWLGHKIRVVLELEYFKIEVLSGDELDGLISWLLELALKLPDKEDIRLLIRLAQILHEAEEGQEGDSKTMEEPKEPEEKEEPEDEEKKED